MYACQCARNANANFRSLTAFYCLRVAFACEPRRLIASQAATLFPSRSRLRPVGLGMYFALSFPRELPLSSVALFVCGALTGVQLFFYFFIPAGKVCVILC